MILSPDAFLDRCRAAAAPVVRLGALRRLSRVPAPSPVARRLLLGVGVSCLVAGVAGSGCAAVVSSGAGASASRADGPGDLVLAARSVAEPVRDLPKAKRGNMAEYTVAGRRYRTLDSAEGFIERGTASWYGAKFHGRETSSGEPFDMHALTAAHRTLPLPTFVRVTNLATGDTVVVKVNDRGPFVDGRVLDLSYAAALRLGMLESGTAEVVVEALSAHVSPTDAERPDDAPDTGAPDTRVEGRAEPGAAATGIDGAAPTFIQLGAFRDGANAASLARRAEPYLAHVPSVEHDAERALFRVRVGPIDGAAALESTLAALATAGIGGYSLVTPPP